jgi:trehalose synthase
MPHTTLQRFLRMVLAVTICLVLGGDQTSFSQTPVPSPVPPGQAQPQTPAPSQQNGQQQTAVPAAGADYIRFLEERSMLFQADQEGEAISGMGVQWRNDFGQPEPDVLRGMASAWLLYYPGSVITAPGKSIIGTWADPQFWAANAQIGIDLLHTNPTERAGGIRGTEFTPTIDGWFDRIGFDTAPELGTEDDIKQLVDNAARQRAMIAGDLVPLHSGLGPDFRLAERGYKDYVGLYNMVQIAQQDWGLLPAVQDPWGTALVSREAAARLTQLGYTPGLIDSADAASGANEWSGWSATPEVMGADGNPRRSVYLHVFKPAQPAYNWLDPSYAARRVQFGDAARNILRRGVRVLRLDADTFLGLEPQPNGNMARHYLTPLANVSTTDVAFMARKLGGWSYQEFAAPLAQLKEFAPNGPDLSYDFFTRAEALYPLINGDALPLRIGHHFLLEAGVPASTLIHDLQNHDEITFQMFELGSHDNFQFEGRTLNGRQMKEQILNTMRTSVAGQAAPYNQLYRPEQDGVATTFAGFIAPALGVADPYRATPDQKTLIQRGHLLVAHANAMIPGVFAISAWDLVGALPIPKESVADRTQDGDWRWINRGGVDLLGVNPSADRSAFGLPKAQMLYGTLPEQLNSPESFVSKLRTMLAARKQFRIHDSEIVSVPNPGNPAVCVLVMRLPDSAGLAITALNYGRANVSIDLDLNNVPSSMTSQLSGGTSIPQPTAAPPPAGSGTQVPSSTTGPPPAGSGTQLPPTTGTPAGSGSTVQPSVPGSGTQVMQTVTGSAGTITATPSTVAGQRARDIVTNQDAGSVSNTGRLTVRLEPLSGRTIVIGPAASGTQSTGQTATTPSTTSSTVPTTPNATPNPAPSNTPSVQSGPQGATQPANQN